MPGGYSLLLDGTVKSWHSVRTHGSTVGDLAIPLNPNKTAADTGDEGPTSEPRLGGIQHILVEFDEAVEAADGSLDPGDVLVTGHVPASVSLDGSGTLLDIRFNENDLPDGQRYTIDLTGRFRTLSDGQLILGNTDCQVRSLEGDSNGTGEVDLMDLVEIIRQHGNPVVEANGRQDLNTDGSRN